MVVIGYRVSWEGYCSIGIPNGWTWRDEKGGIISILPENGGVGVLTLSFDERLRTGKPKHDEAIELLRAFAGDRMPGYDLCDVRREVVAGTRAASGSFVEQDRHWDVWVLVGDRRAVTI